MYTSRAVYEYISTQTNDPIVERKVCTISWTEFPIYQSDLDFYKKISPTFWDYIAHIPTPTLCPEERQRRRSMFRNEKRLYKRKCAHSDRDMVCIYNPDQPYVIYHKDIWWSDARDPMIYGRDFDFEKTLTEQFKDLLLVVPRANFYWTNNENSDYTNHCNNSKNCYLCSDLVRSENCLYSNTSIDSNTTVDSILATNSEYVYQTIDSDKIYNSSYVMFSNDCSDCHYIYWCTNCSFCYWCTNLNNKNFYIYNEKFEEKAYHQKIQSIKNDWYVYFQKLCNKWIHNTSIQHNSEKSCGNALYNDNNVIWSTHIYDSENVKYSNICGWFSDSYDCLETWLESSLLYENHAVMWSTKSAFISISYRNNYSYYLDNSYDNEYLFGCIWLRQKSHCIFNKQYTKYDYEITVAKIIAHMQETWEWWEFFHPSLSPFWYNETVAQEYYPLTETAATERWYARSTYNSDPVIPEWVTTLSWDTVPTDMSTVTSDICKQIIICEDSGRPYMIQPAELKFYQKMNIPLPRKHPDIRHADRLSLRPWRQLHLRSCDRCNEEMLSVYDNTSTGSVWQDAKTVYCETCYQQEVFG